MSLCIAMHSPVVFLHCFWALHRLFHTDQLYITKLHWQQSLHICSRLNNKQVPLYSRASTIRSCVTQGRTKCIFPQISSALMFSFMLYFIKEFQNPFLFGENFWPFFVCTSTVFVCFGLQKNVNTTMWILSWVILKLINTQYPKVLLVLFKSWLYNCILVNLIHMSQFTLIL